MTSMLTTFLRRSAEYFNTAKILSIYSANVYTIILISTIIMLLV